MFETEEFRALLEEVVSGEVRRNNMRYNAAVVDYLQQLASGNERVLMEREFEKAVGFRRGAWDALRSAAELTRDACVYASRQGRPDLQLVDIRKAYEAKFCQFWPFCM
jgi:hypothetical protein